MNSSKDTPVDEHEWELQERAMRAARDHLGPTTDPAVESYRRVAVALGSAPRSEPPTDFASAITGQITPHDSGLERALFRGLFLTLAASSAVVAALYGGQWWQAVQGMSNNGALQWVLAGTGCVALSWMISRLRQAALLLDS